MFSKTGCVPDFSYSGFYALGIAYPEHAQQMYAVFVRLDKLLTQNCLRHLNSLTSDGYLMAIEFVHLWTEDNHEDISLLVERVCHLIGESMMIPKLIAFQR